MSGASESNPARLMCFGFGFSAREFAHYLAAVEPGRWQITGTRTQVTEAREGNVRLMPFSGDRPEPALRQSVREVNAILLSIPPDFEGDIVARHFAEDIANAPHLRWIGYLSTIGVYGNCDGAWIDETAPVKPTTERALRRVRAEQQWQALAKETGKQLDIFRLPGIYGPGRSVIDALRSGTAKRVVKAGQVFNRIHVHDIARTLHRALCHEHDHSVFNVVDDEPAPPQDVVAYAAELLGIPPPPEVPYDEAGMSEMARSFYSESKRVLNRRIKDDLGVTLAFPTYREGLLSLKDQD